MINFNCSILKLNTQLYQQPVPPFSVIGSLMGHLVRKRSEKTEYRVEFSAFETKKFQLSQWKYQDFRRGNNWEWEILLSLSCWTSDQLVVLRMCVWGELDNWAPLILYRLILYCTTFPSRPPINIFHFPFGDFFLYSAENWMTMPEVQTSWYHPSKNIFKFIFKKNLFWTVHKITRRSLY